MITSTWFVKLGLNRGIPSITEHQCSTIDGRVVVCEALCAVIDRGAVDTGLR
jgi:hypothetical protein